MDCGQAQVYYNPPRAFESSGFGCGLRAGAGLLQSLCAVIALPYVVDCGQAQVYYNASAKKEERRIVVDCGQAQVYYNFLA